VTEEQPAAVDAVPAKPRDTGYRSNQLPADVSMVQIKRRYAAIRVRPSGIALRTEANGGWAPLGVREVTKARRPWVLKLLLDDGSTSYLRPFLPGEAGLPDCGGRVGGIGSTEPVGPRPALARYCHSRHRLLCARRAILYPRQLEAHQDRQPAAH
jgi:hypothetical protein